MIFFPSMVKQLQGDFFFIKQIGNGLNPQTTQNEDFTHIRMGFKMPFVQAGMDSAIQTDIYKIN